RSSGATAPSSCSTAGGTRWRAGISTAPGRRSGRAPTSTRKGRRSPSRRSNWRTRASRRPERRRGGAMFQTEYEFTLPCGYLDEDGSLHRHGVMRRATAADEILPLKDPRVVRNPAYLVVILLSRVVTRLDGVSDITPKTIEELYATDLAYLQSL